jgi:hypothetical protein
MKAGTRLNDPWVVEAGTRLNDPWVVEAGTRLNDPWMVEEGTRLNDPWVVEAGTRLNDPWMVEAGTRLNDPCVVEAGTRLNDPWVVEAGTRLNDPWVVEAGTRLMSKLKPYYHCLSFLWRRIWKIDGPLQSITWLYYNYQVYGSMTRCYTVADPDISKRVGGSRKGDGPPLAWNREKITYFGYQTLSFINIRW